MLRAPLSGMAITNKSERKEYRNEESKLVAKDFKLRFKHNNETHRFGPFTMEITSHRILLLPENLKEG